VGFSAFVLALLASTGLAGVRYGAPPPSIAIPTAAGARQLTDERGKPVVINFWATWCHVCIQELPVFRRLAKTYGGRIALVTVSNEPDDVAASYYRLWNIDLPLVADTKGLIFKAYGVGPLPATVVVNAAGVVTFAQVGEVTSVQLDDAVASALAQPAQ
jgi:cytochrome c biogenesis protein CcmG/thiol:disulfide interchange protein DsbE